MAHKVLACILLLALASDGKEKTRWSRQLSSYTADISDWVPLPAPVEREPVQIRRQAIAEPRILSEPFPGFARPTGFNQEDFPPRPLFNAPANRQLYLQAVPSAPQNYLTDQGFGQGLKFGLSQPNFPLSQGFVSPQFNFDSIPQIKARPPQLSNAGKFDNFGKQTQSLSPQIAPQFIGHPHKARPEAPKFVDGYRIVNNSDFGMPKKAPTLQKIKFDSFDKPKEIPQSKSKTEREEVQLLYVPIESLNRGQFNFRSPLTSSQIVNSDLYNQNLRGSPIKQNFADYQRPVPKPLDTFNSQEALNDFNRQLIGFEQNSKFSTLTSPFPNAYPTTPKPKKLKPHQPPLAIFLTPESKDNNVKVGDVLNSLKNADSVAVLDSVNPLNAPKVFIGPSTLLAPENYVKFELPYLSNIENVDKKLRQLPFFVAPLSYNTPQGFAKIPFPSPHVGSVVINAQIKETPQTQPPQPYSRPQVYNQPQYEQNIVTQKPQISYYSTVAPKQNAQPNYQNNYYSIEQQSVSTLSPQKAPSTTTKSPAKPGSYFLNSFSNQFNQQSQYVNFPEEVDNHQPQRVKPYSVAPPLETTTTPRTTVTTTTKPSSTHSSQLLETHNPYSINHAFHFNTPVDYQNFFDEYKETHATPGPALSTTQATIPTTEATTVSTPVVTQSTKHRFSQTYVQNYSPEIHYESEIQSSRRPTYHTKEFPSRNEATQRTVYRQPEIEEIPSKNDVEINKINTFTNDKQTVESQPPIDDSNVQTVNYVPEPMPDNKNTAYIPEQYSQQEINYGLQEEQSTDSSSSTTSTTTTTRRPTLRTRGRPRYTTTRSDTNEYTTSRPTATRRPFRERKQPTNRPRYEPNRITTEKTVKESVETIETTTRPVRTRTRGRIHYKPTGNDEYSEKRPKHKDQDLAYQRDVLHQNYPVTLMERTSTVDIDAITESTAKLQFTNAVDDSKSFDTENAYTNDKPSITEHVNAELAGDIYASKDISAESEGPYATQGNSGYNEDYIYQARSSVAPTTYDEIREQPSGNERQEAEDEVYGTNPSSSVTEQNIPNYSANNEAPIEKQETTTTIEYDVTKANQEVSEDQNQEEQVAETTPTYNRVRVRPGLIRQYHQASTTESSRKQERRKLSQPITYRPAFDKRRTTMRIEEIEADLKTKPVNTRPQNDDHRHPVYKPDPSTESPTAAAQTTETNKRGQFRRRRPVYTTTTTEATARRTYEAKNRFRGRRPTDKPQEKAETQSDASTTTTTRSPLYNRFNHRTKLSERYNKKPEQEELVTEDQEPNYSINRPKYTSPDSERWSPKISKDSFKPYNPNDLVDDTKPEQSELKTKGDELDIITARNDYKDILISVTPATNNNNRVNKKIADIPPTLEAYVEQSKVTKTESNEPASTFESMLEEVMKSLEEQDEDEYTNKVMKHKGGEIGEIPPEEDITSAENYFVKSTASVQEETTTTTAPVTAEDEVQKNDEEDANRKNRRRGFWKKVKVRPISESFEVAESQYYPNTVNTLGEPVSKVSSEKSNDGKKKLKVTTYKPSYQFIKDFFETDDSAFDLTANIDIPKINTSQNVRPTEKVEDTTETVTKNTEGFNPGDMDWGTGSPDPTLEDSSLYSEPTQPTIDRSDGFSFMEYLFGIQANEDTLPAKNATAETDESTKYDIALDTTKGTTDSYIPEEITAETVTENFTEDLKQRDDATEKSLIVENSSISSYMDPANVISTSMSTEVSHETEICFRGKCIKTNKDLL